MGKWKFWQDRWKDLQDAFHKALPWIILGIGLILYIFGKSKTFDNEIVSEVLVSVGGLLSGSALFTVMIKSYQYSKVFRKELEEIIYEPAYLENRKDLPHIWNKITRTLIKDKFKGISGQLLSDVRNYYLPLNDSVYYQDNEHIVEIKLLNKNGDAEIIREYRSRVMAEKETDIFRYRTTSYVQYKKSPTEIAYQLTVKVDAVEVDMKELDIDRPPEQDGNVLKCFYIDLQGKKSYEIIRREVTKYNIFYDNIIFFTALKIHHNLDIELHYPKESLNIELKKAGTIIGYEKKGDAGNTSRYSLNGLIFPNQGYYINIKKTNK